MTDIVPDPNTTPEAWTEIYRLQVQEIAALTAQVAELTGQLQLERERLTAAQVMIDGSATTQFQLAALMCRP